MQREYDLVIWGATGFTGKLVTEYVANQYDQSNLKWAIAGRNRQKLEGIDGARGLNILEADAHDPAALKTLVESTRVILTTVGPYARYGNELVAACARAGTHYCDLTGETHWVRRMIQLHQDEAEQSGAIIVPSCGFDSIPSDLGTYALQKEMLARHGVAANRVTYRARDMRGGFSGGTIDSMMAMMEQAEDDPELFKIAADPYNLNFKWRGLDGLDSNRVHYDHDADTWVAPFVMAPVNTRVVRRSNELLDLMYGSEFCYSEGMATGKGIQGQLAANGVAGGLSTFNVLPRFRPIRELMQRFLPKPGEGPSEQDIQNGYFNIEMWAYHPTDREKTLTLDVHGKLDPGYGATAKMLAESAVALAQDELRVGGGFWTPWVMLC